ncbi:5447_t:CDS:2 [Ambispora gerdemannii]|uniref:5447_t:CDS:1 n=1 Tax=Ambispora gerdemannii TaxID=144530 RepID=A0A9N8ZHQ9_9GLOM|nr:5447_t:CDS:2 [Ambispora gerdemannii]
MSDDEGASNNELLIVAAKQDSEDILEDIFSQPETYDINHVDSVGNTALHYAAQFGSLTAAELLLKQPNIKLDIANKLEGDTPLHKAVQYEDANVSLEIVKLLIEAGADTTKRNKNRQKPEDLVKPDSQQLKTLLQKASMALQVDARDIAAEDSDDDGESASGSD